LVDSAVNWVLGKAIAFVKKLSGDREKGSTLHKSDGRTKAQKEVDLRHAISEVNQLMDSKKSSKKTIKKELSNIKSRYKMTSLVLVTDASTETTETYHAHGVINPEHDSNRHTEVTRMEQVKLTFKCREQYDDKEFQNQLTGQESGLNNMLVVNWYKNRQDYLTRALATGNGRSEEGSKAQDSFRAQERVKLEVKRFEAKIAEGILKEEAKKQAKKEVDDFMKTQAALHDPDQVAGGDPTKVTKLGFKNINSSIGRQWRDQVSKIDEKVNPLIPTLSDEAKTEMHMNVKLEMIRE
jgi:hypothetical protein